MLPNPKRRCFISIQFIQNNLSEELREYTSTKQSEQEKNWQTTVKVASHKESPASSEIKSSAVSRDLQNNQCAFLCETSFCLSSTQQFVMRMGVKSSSNNLGTVFVCRAVKIYRLRVVNAARQETIHISQENCSSIRWDLA
ncbi:hypothetical protein CEXT_259201 [Caerostris extrusa]|uniref:Uncharacterized protein n=1 Tax=Caerostris extrusa TaxID=172846 RepID=A0AAV4PFY5_CAEEX|nr:hypothetical protein CEXT_259201 [Caerostris extrusa]